MAGAVIRAGRVGVSAAMPPSGRERYIGGVVFGGRQREDIGDAAEAMAASAAVGTVYLAGRIFSILVSSALPARNAGHLAEQSIWPKGFLPAS